jgi:hypothetical protein
MILYSISQQRSITILLLAAFSIVIILFSGLHSVSGTSHQSNAFSCLFTVCVAIFSVLMFFTPLLYTSAVFNLIPQPKSVPLLLLDKPPRV